MIPYYLDTRCPGNPRLVRRSNNGHPTSFNTALGTAVAIDGENLQFTYDLVDVSTIRRTCSCAADYLRPAPQPECVLAGADSKINIVLMAPFDQPAPGRTSVFRNTLTSQVSLRGMAFVDEYWRRSDDLVSGLADQH